MLINHEYKFIFVKNAKVASTSIEIALSEFSSARDIITPISSEDEKKRNKLGFRGPQNCFSGLKNYDLKDWYRLLFKNKKKLIFYNHMSAAEILNLVGQKTWNDYFTFCIERNPWDKVVSWYYWKGGDQKYGNISTFIKHHGLSELKQNGWLNYSVNNQLIVDKVLQYENLNKEMDFLKDALKLPKTPSLPYTKDNIRPQTSKYQDKLNHKEKKVISFFFEEEIKNFKYTF